MKKRIVFGIKTGLCFLLFTYLSTVLAFIIIGDAFSELGLGNIILASFYEPFFRGELFFIAFLLAAFLIGMIAGLIFDHFFCINIARKKNTY